MVEMVAEMRVKDLEIKRLRHHVSVLSKRNHQLVEDGKRMAASSIASNASMSSDDEEVGLEKEGEVLRARVVRMEVGERARERVHGDRVPAPWCEEGAEEISTEYQERDRYLGRMKWKVAVLDVAEVVEAESVAEVEEEEVSKPVVRMPGVERVEEGKKKRRIGAMTVDEEEVGIVRGKLIAPLGPKALCGGLMREVGKESVFKEADPRLVAGGECSSSAAVGLSRRTDARRQSPGEDGVYQLRPRVGGYGYRGRGGWSRGRGV